MNYYEVYETDRLLCSGSADNCSRELGISRSAFYTLVFQNKDAKVPKYRILEKKSKREKNKRSSYYTVYLKKSQEVIATGDAASCAATLNRSMHSFYSLVTRVRNGQNEKYEIEVETIVSDTKQ